MFGVIGLSRLCALEFESRSEQVVLDREKLSGAVDLLGKLETVKLKDINASKEKHPPSAPFQASACLPSTLCGTSQCL